PVGGSRHPRQAGHQAAGLGGHGRSGEDRIRVAAPVTEGQVDESLAPVAASRTAYLSGARPQVPRVPAVRSLSVGRKAARMIRSMTGYGCAEGRHKGTPITVEIRSVNHRHGEVMAKLPRALQAHEDRIRDLVQARVARGRVEVTVNFSGERDPGRGVVLDWALARRYHALLKELQRELGLKEIGRASCRAR